MAENVHGHEREKILSKDGATEEETVGVSY